VKSSGLSCQENDLTVRAATTININVTVEVQYSTVWGGVEEWLLSKLKVHLRFDVNKDEGVCLSPVSCCN
jgi:hypothetical protein